MILVFFNLNMRIKRIILKQPTKSEWCVVAFVFVALAIILYMMNWYYASVLSILASFGYLLNAYQLNANKNESYVKLSKYLLMFSYIIVLVIILVREDIIKI